MRIFTLLLLGLIPLGAFSQDSDAPYLRNPTLPSFSLLMEDSTHWITQHSLRRGVPVIIMLFSPDCSHCREQTVIFKKNMDRLRHTEIVMTTFQPLHKIRDFCREYELHQHKNIHVGRDVKFFFAPFYRIKYAPFLAIYDRQHQFVKAFEGDTKIDKLLEVLK